jgi:hypothetical protein
MVTDAGHPWTIGRRPLHVQPEIAPYLGLGRLVLVGVAKVAVHEMEEGRQRLDLADGIERVVLRLSPFGGPERRSGRTEVAEAGEGEGGAAGGGSREGTHAGRREGPGRGRGPVADLVRVRLVGAEAGQASVIGEHFFARDAVGIGLHDRGHTRCQQNCRCPIVHDGVGLLHRRRPRDHHAGGRILPPLQVHLFGCCARSECSEGAALEEQGSERAGERNSAGSLEE